MTYKDLMANPSLMPKLFHKQAQRVVDETQLENDFAQMAYIFVQDITPKLTKYILGFEIVERNEDGSKTAGIFGLKIGDDFYYIPAFFTNNQVKGIDSLYSRKTNMMVPLTEKWVDKIVAKKVNRIINTEDTDIDKKDFDHPDFNEMLSPPDIVKNASECQLAYSKLAATTGFMLQEDPDLREAFTGVVASLSDSEINSGKSEISELIATNEKFANCFIKTLEKDAEFATIIHQVYGDPINLIPRTLDFGSRKVAKKLDVEVLHETSYGLDEKEKGDVVRHGFVIKDKRDPKFKSRVESSENCEVFDTPTIPGEYLFELKSGDVSPGMLLGVFKKGTTQGEALPNEFFKMPNFMTFLQTGGGTGGVFSNQGIIDVNKQDETKGAEIYNSAVSPSRLNTGDQCIIIDSSYIYYGQFKIESKIKFSEGRLSLGVWQTGSGPRNGILSISVSDDYTKPLLNDNVLNLPKSIKVIKIINGDTLSPDASPLASLDDAYAKMLKMGYLSLDIKPSTGSGFKITRDWDTSKTLDYKEACIKLVFDYGLGYEDSKKLLKEAKEGRSLNLIKEAQGVGVSMPSMQQPRTGGDSGFGTTMNYKQENVQHGEYIGMPEVNPEGVPMMEELNHLIENAAASGQKKVFDHGAIGGLVKVYDIDTIISGSIGDMRKSLDRLGRIIFLFYWKPEDFTERFGSEKIVEMEDSLQGVYKGFGDLIIDLSKREIEGKI